MQEGKSQNSSVSFSSVLEAANIPDPDYWDLEITDVDKFKKRITVKNEKLKCTEMDIVDLRKLKGKTIMNIGVDLVKLAIMKYAGVADELKPKKSKQTRIANAADFLEFAKKKKWRIVSEFHDDKNQWVVYEVPSKWARKIKGQKPEPTYWVTGDPMDWQPGYEFNGGGWLIQKIRLDDQERLVIQKVVHEDIKENQFEFTGSKNPFVNVENLQKYPTYNSTWRLYQSIDGKIKHYIDIIKQPAYDRYYYKGEPLYRITEEAITNKKNKVNFIHKDKIDLADYGVPGDAMDPKGGKDE